MVIEPLVRAWRPSTVRARDHRADHYERGIVNHPTPPEQPAEIVARLRATFRTGRTKPVEWRTGQLGRLRELLTEHGKDVAAALHADLGKSSKEAYRTEIDFTIREIDHTLEHLDGWLRPSPPRSLSASAPTPRPGRSTTRWASSWSSPLELSGPVAADPGRRRAGRRQRRGDQAERAGPRHLRGRRATAAAVSGHRRGRGRRGRHPGDHGSAGRALRPHLLHRQRRGRPYRDARRRRAPHPGRPRTRRKVTGVRRHRHRCERRRRPAGPRQVPQRRPDLCRPRLRPDRPGDRRRAGARARQGRREPVRHGPVDLHRVRPHRQRTALRPARRAARLGPGRHRWSQGPYDEVHRAYRPGRRRPGVAGDAGGDLRPDPADRHGARPRRRDRFHQRP